MSENVKDLRKQLRAKTVGGKNEFKKKIIVIDGSDFEIRQPSVAEKSNIMTRSKVRVEGGGKNDAQMKMDYGLMAAYSVIECVYVPGTDTKVFEESDLDILLNKPTGGFVDTLSGEVLEMMNAIPEQAVKN